MNQPFKPADSRLSDHRGDVSCSFFGLPGLFNVFPGEIVLNGENGREGCSVSFGYLGKRLAIGKATSYIRDHAIGEFRKMVARSLVLPVLEYHIFAILLVIPKKQVVRSDAGSVVAFMKDEHPWRDLTNVKPPRDSVGSTLSKRAAMDVSIPRLYNNTVPHPTSIRLRDIGEEFFQSQSSGLSVTWHTAIIGNAFFYLVRLCIKRFIANQAMSVRNLGRHIGQSFCSLFRVIERRQPLFLPQLIHISESSSTKGFQCQ